MKKKSLFEQVESGKMVTLTDMKGKPFQVQAAYFGDCIIGLFFYRDGKKDPKSPLMNKAAREIYLNQF